MTPSSRTQTEEGDDTTEDGAKRIHLEDGAYLIIDEEEAGAGSRGKRQRAVYAEAAAGEGDDPILTAELSPEEVQARKLNDAEQAGQCIDLTKSGSGDVIVKEEKHAPAVDPVTTKTPDASQASRWNFSRPKPKFSDLFASLEACPLVVQAKPSTRQELAELKGKHVQVLQSGQMNKKDFVRCVRHTVGDAALKQALNRLGFHSSQPRPTPAPGGGGASNPLRDLFADELQKLLSSVQAPAAGSSGVKENAEAAAPQSPAGRAEEEWQKRIRKRAEEEWQKRRRKRFEEGR